MNGINPKWGMYLGLAILLEQTVGHGGAALLTGVVPASWIDHITATANLLATLGTVIMTYQASVSSPQPGPMINTPIAPVAKAAIFLAVALALLSFPGGAQAQTRRPAVTGNIVNDIKTDIAGGVAPGAPGQLLTGNPEKDLQALWQKIVSSSLVDLNYAAAMAANANTTTSTVRLQCLKAIIQLNEQASGANLKNADGSPMVKPDPHLFTDVESLAEIIDNLSPQGPLFVSCAGAAQLAKTNVLSFVNAVVTGVAGFAAMPVIPGL